MNIEWGNLGLVALVTICVATLMVTVVSIGAALMTRAAEKQAGGGTAVAGLKGGAFVLFALAGLGVLFGIYLIVPYFR